MKLILTFSTLRYIPLILSSSAALLMIFLKVNKLIFSVWLLSIIGRGKGISKSKFNSSGDHHELLNNQGWDIDYLRGPLKEFELLNLIHEYDGVLCGDDEYTKRILQKGSKGKLKALAKYGVGLDKIDCNAARN